MEAANGSGMGASSADPKPAAPPSAPAPVAKPWPAKKPDPVETDWCIDAVEPLDEETCFVLPEKPSTELLIYLHGIVPPEKTSIQKTNFETVVVIWSGLFNSMRSPPLPKAPVKFPRQLAVVRPA